MKLTLCFILHLCLFIAPLKEIAAQNIKSNFKNYRISDGLPSLVTYQSIQDSKGFLWVTTDNGVSRFDGKNFKNFSKRDGLAGNEIVDLYEDSKGRIWFLSFSNGICYYYNEKFYNSSNNKSVKKLTQLGPLKLPIDDGFGNLFFQEKKRFPKLISLSSNNKITTFSPNSTLQKRDTIIYLYKSSDRKSIFCITKNHSLLQIKNNKASVVLKAFTDIKGGSFFRDKKNQALYFVNDTGLYKITDSKLKLILKNFKVPKGTSSYGISIDKYNNIWISSHAYNTLIYRFEAGNYLKPHAVLPSSFANITFDNENNIWLNTSNKGIYKLPYHLILNKKTFHINQSLLKANITSIFLAKNNTLWVGYDNGWVSNFLNSKQPIHYNINFKKRSYNRILEFLEDSGGNIWCISDDYCVKFKKKKTLPYFIPKKINTNNDPVSLNACKTIMLDNSGRIIITTRKGVFYAQPDGLEAIPLGKFSNRLYSSYVDSTAIYVSSEKGIIKITNNDTLNLSNKEAFLNIRAQTFFKLSGQVLLLTTYNNGIVVLENDKITSVLNTDNGLIGANCKKIIHYKDTLYIVTNAGITKAAYNNKKFTIYSNFKFINYPFTSHLNGAQIKNDSFYISSYYGINILPLPIWQKKDSPPQLILQSFKVNNTSYDLSKQIKFRYKPQTVKVKFISPVINNSSTLKYRYKFVNGDGDWQVTTSNQLEFTNLKYGKYNVLLQVKKYNSPWSSSSNITFTIITPFYATWWFKSTLIACFCLILVIITKASLNRKYKKKLIVSQRNAEIEKERTRIAADLHDDIGGDLTSIAILSNIINNSVQGAHAKISKRINLSAIELIDKLNEVIWALDSTNNTLHSLAAYIRRIVSEFSEKNELNIKVSVNDNVYDETKTNSMINRNVILIIKESLNNIVKHSKSENVYFSLQKLDNYLCILIKDDGVGFNIAEKKEGNGLTNMQKRVADIKGKITINSSLNKGVTIEVKIPL